MGKSKTKGGQGRVIPLNDEAYEILLEWHERFSNQIITFSLLNAMDSTERMGTYMKPSKYGTLIRPGRWAR